MADPRPHRLSDVEGQDKAKAAITAALAAERIPSAWLFAGPRGVGKFTTAMAVASAINCGAGDSQGGGLFGGAPEPSGPKTDACGTCASCRKIASGNHPDVRVVRVPPEKRVIPIESVRDVIAELAFRPYEGKRRVVIVDGAESLTPQAANALLKSLEEPPPHSTWIVIADSPSRLLPTVVSRCRIVRFGALPVDVAAALLAREGGMQPAEAKATAALLGGSVGRALGEQGAYFAREVRATVVDEALAAIRHGGARVLDVADGWDKREKSGELPLSAALEHLSSWARDLAVWQASGDRSRLLHGDLLDRIEPVAKRVPPPAVARAFDAIRLCVRDVAGNVNDKLAIEQMLLGLRRELG